MLNKGKYILISLIFISKISIHAQNSISGSVEYGVILDNGADKTKLSPINERDKAREDSVYKASNGRISNKGFVNLTQLLVFNGVEAGTYVDVESKKVLRFYQNHLTKTLLGVEFTMSGRYLVADTLMPIIWKLSKNTKKIQNIQCFSAQAEYRGRVWTAWYAPSIPVSSGPWKLYGLPGLILEAEDIIGLTKFECTKITIPKPKDIEVSKNSFSDDKRIKETVSYDRYIVLLRKSLDNFEKMGSTSDKDGTTTIAVNISNLEIFAFEEAIGKRKQQKLYDTPKK